MQLEALIYVDDIASAGDHRCAQKTIEACSAMERWKKFTFNLDKSAVVVIKASKKEEVQPITVKVKKGYFKIQDSRDVFSIIDVCVLQLNFQISIDITEISTVQ